MSVMQSTAATAKSAVKFILDKGIAGVPPLAGAEKLAEEYLLDVDFKSNAESVRSLVRWETSKNFTSGFLTGLGGLITMPASVPSALGASWILQARLAGAIAHIYGHNIDDDRVQTFVLLSLAGDSAGSIVKDAGIQVGRKLTERAIAAIPGRALIEINKAIGFRLITKAGEKGIVNLSKAVPVAGGLVGGGLDALACKVVGRTADTLFRRDDG